jgi:uncharacterized NAD(P)/FAD-binding protein YdhS
VFRVVERLMDGEPEASPWWLHEDPSTTDEMTMGQRIGVIGASSTGVSVLAHLVRDRTTTPDLVTLIDPNPPGRGPVFNAGGPRLLCNTSAGYGSLIRDRPDDFLDHLAGRGQPTKADAFVARDRVGEYVRSRFEEDVDLAAARGVKVDHLPARAASVRRRATGRYEVRLDEGMPQEFDQVAVCVGYGRPKTPMGFARYARHPKWIRSPYPAAGLGARLNRPGSHVLVLGTGLSAIDAALVLCEQGHRVTMASRTGGLPAVRTRMLAPPFAVPSLAGIADLSPDDPHVHRKLLRLVVDAARTVAPIPLRHQLSAAADPVDRLREEVALAAAGLCHWQDIAAPVLTNLRVWLAGLPSTTRTALLSPCRRLIWRYIAAMPLESARMLRQHIDAGQLRVAAYQPIEVRADGAGFEVGITGTGRRRFDYAVNAIGCDPPRLCFDADTVYLTNPPPGAATLRTLDRDLRVRLGPHAPPERIWLAGVSTHIHIPFANDLAESVAQASRVAQCMTTPRAQKR